MLAVDDAGAGYAGLHHILELRPQYVKLDISLVRNIDTDPARQAMVTGMARFAESVGCALIAEGIETAERADRPEASARRVRAGLPPGEAGHDRRLRGVKGDRNGAAVAADVATPRRRLPSPMALDHQGPAPTGGPPAAGAEEVPGAAPIGRQNRQGEP